MSENSKFTVVVGMGKSGEAAARLALRSGRPVRLLERRQDPVTEEKAGILRALGIEVFLGPHAPGMLDGAEEIVVSPGVSAACPVFAWAREKGLPLAGEMEWASRRFDGKLVAVTGTNGKTTTTALIAHLLNENGVPAAACGNIGTPLAQVILSEQIPQIAVAEVSSFQLETVETFHPAVSLFLNFTLDHLDRHASLNEYWLAKIRMYKNQGRGDWALFHSDLADRLRPLMQAKNASFATFGADAEKADVSARGGAISWRGRGNLCGAKDVPLLGDHNLENACAAAAAAFICGLQSAGISRAMKTFRPVDHRLQTVAEISGVRFINDSKATNTDSLKVALRSFPERVVLIAGGRDKNQDFGPLRQLVQEKVKAAVLIGEGADKMASAWGDGNCKILRAGTLPEAVEAARREAQPAGVVLLSPACASFDMFRDYEHRGREFARCVEELKQRPAGVGA